MAFVPNLADQSGKIDRPFTRPNRIVAATPYASLTPQFRGEIVAFQDATNKNNTLFRAMGLTSSDWTQIAPTEDL
jgi:hypothetical protein